MSSPQYRYGLLKTLESHPVTPPGGSRVRRPEGSGAWAWSTPLPVAGETYTFDPQGQTYVKCGYCAQSTHLTATMTGLVGRFYKGCPDCRKSLKNCACPFDEDRGEKWLLMTRKVPLCATCGDAYNTLVVHGDTQGFLDLDAASQGLPPQGPQVRTSQGPSAQMGGRARGKMIAAAKARYGLI